MSLLFRNSATPFNRLSHREKAERTPACRQECREMSRYMNHSEGIVRLRSQSCKLTY